MRHVILLLSITIICGCSQQPEEQESITTVSGTITNAKGNVFRLRYNDENYYDSLDASNSFTMELEIENPTSVMFGHGGERTVMYIKPGDQLSFSLDTEQFDETLTYTGDRAANNNYLAAVYLLEEQVMVPQELYGLSESAFLNRLDSVKQLYLAKLDEVQATDKDFRAYTTKGLEWKMAGQKLIYERAHKSITGNDSFAVSSDFYDFQDELNLTDTSLIDHQDFRVYVNRYLDNIIQDRMASEPDQDIGMYFKTNAEVIEENITATALKEELLYDVLNSGFTYLDAPDRSKLIDNWKNLNPAKTKLEKINRMTADLKKLETGNPAPAFSYPSIDGDTIGLEDFRGQIVYIDLWATWCRPCLAEQPAMAAIQEQFKDDPVAFVAIAIDDSPEPWRRMVAERKLGGIHLYAPGAFDANIMQDYMVRGIPRFILIDEEGKIVDANAARPSDDIDEQLSALLKTV